MKTLILILFLIIKNAIALDFKITKLSGETNYEYSSTQSLNTSFKVHYKINIYESKNKKWILHLNGNLNPDYDHFGNEYKLNGFTAIGIDF